ncbi:MAG: GLPGLI family protein [Crocinitomicaceae bacterium]|nr:GLPGLI family protein [Crocinitomicaceae bacterium]
MRVEGVCSKMMLWGVALLVSGLSFGQIYEGKVVFERRTNLEKRYKGQEMNRWMKGDMKKPKIDLFELHFNDTSSVFVPIESDIPDEREWSTMKNLSYQNLNTGTRKQEFSFWGTKVLLKDSLNRRAWKITESSRNIAGYNCKQAVWEANDSVRIYAWYAEELISSTGPETFNGLPGVILGLATEDGGVVYFAKEVQAMKVNVAENMPTGKSKDWYNEDSLRALVIERFSNWGSSVTRMVDDMFLW